MSTDETQPLPTQTGSQHDSAGPQDSASQQDSASRHDSGSYRAGGASGQFPAHGPAYAQPRISTRVRLTTIVWGAVIAGVGAALLAVASGAEVDLELASIGLLALAGLAMLTGAVAAGVRHRP